MGTLDSLNGTVGVFTQTYRYLQLAHKPKANLNLLKFDWARQTLSSLRVKWEVVGVPSSEKSLLFLGNHISYLDIPLLLAATRGISFVAKHEINAWPVFGHAARKIDTVFVKRENGGSRKSARASIHQALQDGNRIAIFPSGTTCITESKDWRHGAFEIAHEGQFQVQPFRISYSPLRAVAYIDRDFFPMHLFNLFATEGITARIEFHEPVLIQDPKKDCLHWQEWAREIGRAKTPSRSASSVNSVSLEF